MSLILCCNKNLNKESEFREGIRDNILRVAVFQFIPDEEAGSGIDEIILNAAKSRAALLLVSYASLNIDRSSVTPLSDAIMNREIGNIIESGAIKWINWNENAYCLAFVEYDINSLNTALIMVNKKGEK